MLSPSFSLNKTLNEKNKKKRVLCVSRYGNGTAALKPRLHICEPSLPLNFLVCGDEIA